MDAKSSEDASSFTSDDDMEAMSDSPERYESPRRRRRGSSPRRMGGSSRAQRERDPRRGGAPRDTSARESVEAIVNAVMGGLQEQMVAAARQQAAIVALNLAGQAVASGSGRINGSGVEPASARHQSSLAMNMVGVFDPSSPGSNVEQWLSKIDELGAIYGWSDLEKSSLLQARLSGTAKLWHQRLDSYDRPWAAWQAMLGAAFPTRPDFHGMLVEMMRREKLTGESMTAYYHAKLALCGRVGITGENAVSCIIAGLAAELRASAYGVCSTSPEELYRNLLAGLDTHGRIDAPRAATEVRPTTSRLGQRRPALKRRNPVAEGVRCYNCQQVGDHLSRDCPRARADRCRRCGGEGHWAAKCPKRLHENNNQDGRLFRDSPIRGRRSHHSNTGARPTRRD